MKKRSGRKKSSGEENVKAPALMSSKPQWGMVSSGNDAASLNGRKDILEGSRPRAIRGNTQIMNCENRCQSDRVI